jgi:hypothetical protein
VRGGEAGRVSAGGAVFRVRRVWDLALLVVQCLLTLWGTALVAFSILEYSGHAQLQQGLTISGLESSLHAPSTDQLLFEGTLGLVALGVSGALLYVRRLYLSRPQ